MMCSLSAQGRLTAVKSAVSETLFTAFDQVGRITAHRQVLAPGTPAEQAYPLRYRYDLAGHLTAQVYPSGRTVTHLFDMAGRLSRVSGQPTGAGMKTYAAAIAYTAHGAVEAVMLGNLLWEHTQFNLRLQPTEVGLGVARTDSSTLKLSYRYGMLVYFDEGGSVLDETRNNGNVQSQSITAPNLMLTQSYSYDEVNRVRRAGETNGGGAESWQQTFTYDRYGNRRFDPATTTAGLMTENPVYDAASNRISPQAGEAYQYDAVGNLTKDKVGNTYAYDGENRQVTYNGGASGSGGATYSYDGDGRRVEKVAGVVRTVFVYNVVGQMVAEYSSAAAVANGTQYVTSDNLGTPRVITGADGAVKGRHDYLPFGEELFAGTGGRTTGQGYVSDNVRQGFTGYEKDGETGLNFAQRRYYSPTQGRFTSVDPENADAELESPQSWNGYAYARNNPQLYTDPTGEGIRICGPDGKNCYDHENKDLANLRKQCEVTAGCEIKDDRRTGGRIIQDGQVIATFANELDGTFAGSVFSELSRQAPVHKEIMEVEFKFMTSVMSLGFGGGGGTTLLGIAGGTAAYSARTAVSALIRSAGQLTRLSKGVQQGFIRGNPQQIIQNLTQGATKLPSGAYRLADGTFVRLYTSTSSGAPTLSIKVGEQLFKIRILP